MMIACLSTHRSRFGSEEVVVTAEHRRQGLQVAHEDAVDLGRRMPTHTLHVDGLPDLQIRQVRLRETSGLLEDKHDLCSDLTFLRNCSLTT